MRRSICPPIWSSAPKVLLVEDDAVNRILSSKFLQIFGCLIEVASDGISAVNKMRVEEYDLVFMDISLPELDGISATSIIRESDQRTPIIAMTSNLISCDVFKYFACGMNDVLPKPFTKEYMLRLLEKYLTHLTNAHQLSRTCSDGNSKRLLEDGQVQEKKRRRFDDD